MRSADHRRVHDSGGSNGGFHPRTLPPCFGYSHLARLSRYAHAAWTPWDRARPSIRKEMRTCVAGRYAQTNRRVHQRPPTVLVRRKHEEIYPHPNNPSVNSRKAYSRFALQTQDLDVQKPNFPGIWGDFGGTLRRSSGTSFRRDGFTAPIPSQPCWPVLVNACTKWRELLLPRVFRGQLPDDQLVHHAI